MSYPKGDLRRVLSVLAAIDSMPDATLVKVVAKTGLDKKSVTNLITQAGEQAGVKIIKSESVYTLKSWGAIIKRADAKNGFDGCVKRTCNTHINTHVG